MRRFCCALLVSLVAVVALPAPAAAEATYSSPVDAPVVDHFRPPQTPFGPGNRGIDFDTDHGDAVRAAAGGEVVFSGWVGGSRHVVVLHPDGLRTSYSFLHDVEVERGHEVDRGDVVGIATSRLHFGVRAGDDRYLDPAALLTGDAPGIHLVPVVRSEGDEGSALLRFLGGVARLPAAATAAAVDWARSEVAATWQLLEEEVAGWATALELAWHYLHIPEEAIALFRRRRLFEEAQRDCTPASAPLPPVHRERRIAVLVGGYGSASGAAAVLDLDTRALGYADGDVAQFSYAGGQAPGPRQLADVPVTSYDAADSRGDIRVAGQRLRSLLEEIRRRHPGVAVDLLAHSQGGLVVRSALGEGTDGIDPRLPRVEHVVTLGSPHHGADAATANAALGTSATGGVVRHGADRAADLGTGSVAAGQLSEEDDFIEDLRTRPLPVGARFTSIAARGDVVVPTLQSGLEGATNVVVPLDGSTAHDRLPGSAEAAREVRLALAGQGPTCRAVGGDLWFGLGASVLQDVLGGGSLVGGQWVDRWVGQRLDGGDRHPDPDLPPPSRRPEVPGGPAHR